jgi:hypothetical protein
LPISNVSTSPKPRLIILNGESSGTQLDLHDGTLTVGRESDNTMVIDDATISRHHAELLVFSPEIIVRDLNSTNGTLVHDRWLTEAQCQVLSGQIVVFGLVATRVELEPVRPSKGATTAILEHQEYMHLVSQRPSLAHTFENSSSKVQMSKPKCSGFLTSLITYPATLMRAAKTRFTGPGRCS